MKRLKLSHHFTSVGLFIAYWTFCVSLVGQTQTLQVGETLAISDEIGTSTSTTLQLPQGSLGQKPSDVTAPTPNLVANTLTTQQSIFVVSVSPTGVSVTTQGLKFKGEDSAPGPATTYKIFCGTGNHFDDPNFMPSADDNAILQETCEMLERIDGVQTFLNSIGSGPLATNAAGAHIIMPLVYEPPDGNWTLAPMSAPSPAGSFSLDISNATAPNVTWTGQVHSLNNGDDLSVSISSNATVPSTAPSGEPMTATVKTSIDLHREVVRQLPSAPNPTP